MKTKGLVLGFTGTQEGMTNEQRIAFRRLVVELAPDKFRHGDCIGADADAHNIVRHITTSRIWIVGHPPIKRVKRAMCQCDELLELKDYLPRNHDIVDNSAELYAVPRSRPKIRSGTWATVRYANRMHKPVTVIWPNGKVSRNFIYSEYDPDKHGY